MILDAAGETDIGENPSLDKANGDRLDETALAEIFRKSTVQLRGTTAPGLVERQGGKATRLICAPDGSVSMFVEGNHVETGKWWIEGDKICVEGREITRGRPFCGFLVLDGSTLKVFDREETRSDVFRISLDQKPMD